MSDNYLNNLEKIIAISEQILLESSTFFNQDLDNEKEAAEEGKGIIENLLKLSKERDTLIKLTFNKEETQKYERYLPLINKVVELDRQITAQSDINKNTVRAKLLKLKKNKKAVNIYNQY